MSLEPEWWPRDHRLVNGFDYDESTEDAQILHPDGLGHSDDNNPHLRHARVITLSTWYRLLLRTVLTVSMTVVDMQSNLMLIVALFAYPVYDFIATEAKVLFALLWLASMLLTLVAAIKTARWQYSVSSNPRVGDLITNCNNFDTAITFIALIIFNFFDVQGQVREIVIQLHPWKSVQPFVAFKCEGTRA